MREGGAVKAKTFTFHIALDSFMTTSTIRSAVSPSQRRQLHEVGEGADYREDGTFGHSGKLVGLGQRVEDRTSNVERSSFNVRMVLVGAASVTRLKRSV